MTLEFPFLGSSEDWDEWTAFEVDVEDGVATLGEDLVPTYRSPTAVAAVAGVQVVDVAPTDCGTVYVLTGDGKLYLYDPELETGGQFECLWAADGGREPSALCVTDETVYLGWVGEQGRVQALSRHLLATRWVLDDPFVGPRRIVRLDGDVYVLDRATDTEEGSLYRLEGGRPTVEDLGAFTAARDLAPGDDGRLYLLDGTPSVRILDPTADGVTESSTLPPAAFGPTDGRVVPTCLTVAGELEVVVGVGDGFDGDRVLYRYVSDRGPSDDPGTFERVPTYTGGSHRLVLGPPRRDVSRSLYLISDPERSLHSMTQTRRHHLVLGGSAPFAGRLLTRFDSGEFGTEWHRVVTALSVAEAGTQVRLSYHATEDADLRLDRFESIYGIGAVYERRLRVGNVLGLSGLATLRPETVAALTGVTAATAASWISEAGRRTALWQSYPHPNPRDGLLEGAVGRYLWVELELLGEEFTSPRVESFRAYFPRQSYLRYLPAVYHEDEASAALLERFLSLFESVFVGVDEGRAGFTRYLDTDGIPAEYLSWLGGWLGLGREASWPVSARRELLRSAPDLFRARGTASGLLQVLDIYLDSLGGASYDWASARDREATNLDALVASGTLTEAEREAVLGRYETLSEAYELASRYLLTFADVECADPPAREDYRRLVQCPQCFLVLVRPGLADEEVRAVRRLVATWKPAHATGRAAPLRREFRLGANAFLGVNAALSEGTFVVEDALLGTDSVLTEREGHGQLGLRGRLGEDASLS